MSIHGTRRRFCPRVTRVTAASSPDGCEPPDAAQEAAVEHAVIVDEHTQFRFPPPPPPPAPAATAQPASRRDAVASDWADGVAEVDEFVRLA